MEAVLEVMRYVVPPLVSILGAFILFYLKDLRDKTRTVEERSERRADEADEAIAAVREDLAAHKERVAERYATKDHFVREMSRFETGVTELLREISKEQKLQRQQMTDFNSSLSALQERTGKQVA